MVSLKSKTTPDLQREHRGGLIATHAMARTGGPEQGLSHHGLLCTHPISASPRTACPEHAGKTLGRFVRIFSLGELNAGGAAASLQATNLLRSQQSFLHPTRPHRGKATEKKKESSEHCKLYTAASLSSFNFAARNSKHTAEQDSSPDSNSSSELSGVGKLDAQPCWLL